MLPARPFPPAVQAFLAEDRLNDLGPGQPDPTERAKLRALHVEDLFPAVGIADRTAAQACLAGLWLLHDCLDESHTLSQDLSSVEGSYWHGIMHRREPDFGNAKYWFRRVGTHPIFAPLAVDAAQFAVSLLIPQPWDPFWFVDFCDTHFDPDAKHHRLAQQIQQREWELLFGHCYRLATSG